MTPPQNYIKTHPADSVAIGLLIFWGGIYRIVGLGSSAFWYDESYSLLDQISSPL